MTRVRRGKRSDTSVRAAVRSAEMRHKWLIALLFGWGHVQTEFALGAWLERGSANANFYYFSSLLGVLALIGTVVTAFGAALELEEREERQAKQD